jgi:hypothetical protein
VSTFAKLGEWRGRLNNWGRWRWNDLMAGAPDSSCVNSIWDNYIWHDDAEGYGDVAEAVMVPQAQAARAELEPVDDADAEDVHGWVRQISAGHRAVLSRRYVFRQYVEPDRIDLAISAILHLVGENRRVVERMRCG